MIQQFLDDAEAREAEAQRHMYEIHNRNILQELSPWLRRINWMTRFDEKDMKVLHDLLTESKRNGSDPDRLWPVWKSVVRVIEECWESARDCSNRDWKLILHWLTSASKTEHNLTPFSIYTERSIRKTYAEYWQQFMIFVLRGMNDSNQQYEIEYTESQLTALREIEKKLKNEEISNDELDRKVRAASLLFIEHSNFVKQRSALLYFTDVVRYHVSWKRWKSPDIYTPILAGIQWVMRVLVLKSAILEKKRDNWFELHVDDSLQCFKSSHDKYLVKSEAYSYDQIHTLLNYELKASVNVTTRSRISWSSDRKILYLNDKPLKIKVWKRLYLLFNVNIRFIHELLTEAESMLAKRLLFRRDETLPSIDLYSYRDNPCNRQTEHYFALDGPDALKKAQARMMKDLRKSFKWAKMMKNSEDDLNFNPAVVKSYEKWDVRFRRILLILITLTCGLSGRGLFI